MVRTKYVRGDRSASKDAARLAGLVREAQRQPGIQDLLFVYEHWRKFEEAALPHRRAAALRPSVYSSDSSTAGPPA